MRAIRWGMLVVMTAVVVSSVGGHVWAEETSEQILARLKTKADAVKTVRANMKMTMAIMGQAITMEGSALIAAPGKSRMEMAMNLGGMKMDQIIVSDGATVWTYQPALKMAHRIDVVKVAAETGVEQAGQQAGDLTKPLAGLVPASVKLVRTEKVGDVEWYVFEGAPALPKMPQIPFKPAKIEVTISAEDGLLRKSVMLDANGKEMISQAYDNVEVNVDIPEERFQFTPPEGVQVTDMTEGVLNMLKTMKHDTE
ncbi:MAG: hypothetical protein U1E05_09865 [Patescibacteria group bacterium]|nr:hypothetical protein [Patescibacteria group bacterium]